MSSAQLAAGWVQSAAMSATTHLVLDIETIPDTDLYTPPQPLPGMERPFPPLFACKPVVIGVLWLDENMICKKMGTIGEAKDEAGMLADFAEFMGKWKPRLVTWNGRGFDLPVLMLRSLRYGLSVPWYYRDPGFRYRFSAEGHWDLGDYLADFGAARMASLHGAARLIGLPGKEDGIDGSQVEGLYRAGQMEILRQYCLSDVVQTAFVFLRTRLLLGEIDRPSYTTMASNLLAAVEADGRQARMMANLDRARLLLTE
jgi:predicted PolB exonuclease-like 3'-5' exonuclease